MEKTKNSSLVWKIVATVLAIALIVVSLLYATNTRIGTKADNPSTPENSLSLWNDDAAAKNELLDYVKTVTDEGSEKFIPEEDRIAVFDLDGTLACETDPVYFDHCILYHRIAEDENYKNKASKFEKEVAKEVKAYMETGESAEDLMLRHGQAVASAFKGMTPEEFLSYVSDYANTPANGYNGMTKAEAFYKPMLEVVELLKQNDFTVYVVSGTDRFIVRGLVEASPLDLPDRQIIGSDESLVASDQGNTDGLDYQFDDDDKLITGGKFLIKNLDMNKVTVIQQEIGKQPVLSFGNSGSDSSMAEYTINDNKYEAKAFMLCCDDTECENGNIEKAEKMAQSCKDNGWTAISMKNDWKTIYGDKVTKK